MHKESVAAGIYIRLPPCLFPTVLSMMCMLSCLLSSKRSRFNQICNLEEQLEQFKEELENKSEEVQQLHMQLEIQRKEIISQQQYLETRERMLQVTNAPALRAHYTTFTDFAVSH